MLPVVKKIQGQSERNLLFLNFCELGWDKPRSRKQFFCFFLLVHCSPGCHGWVWARPGSAVRGLTRSPTWHTVQLSTAFQLSTAKEREVRSHPTSPHHTLPSFSRCIIDSPSEFALCIFHSSTVKGEILVLFLESGFLSILSLFH